MLNQFVLRNYRLFKNETLLDFFPAPINEHKASLLTAQEDGESFLPVISLYGPNGCGKSSILDRIYESTAEEGRSTSFCTQILRTSRIGRL